MTDNVLKILGFAMRIPPSKDITQFSTETLAHLSNNIRQRFSDQGRMDFAKVACQDLRRFGFQVPKDTQGEDIEWYADGDCQDAILDADYAMFTNEMVDETIAFLEECMHPQTQQPAQHMH